MKLPPFLTMIVLLVVVAGLVLVLFFSQNRPREQVNSTIDLNNPAMVSALGRLCSLSQFPQRGDRLYYCQDGEQTIWRFEADPGATLGGTSYYDVAGQPLFGCGGPGQAEPSEQERRECERLSGVSCQDITAECPVPDPEPILEEGATP